MSPNNQIIKKAWVVDDDPMYGSFTENNLKVLGYSVTRFMNGEDCLKALENLPDIIVLDHNLGDGINGLETLSAIKSVNTAVPVVYLSAQDDITSAVAALKTGAFDYIEKNSSAVVRLRSAIEKIEDINTLMKRRYQSQVRILSLTAIACFAMILSFIFYFVER